MTTSYVQYNSDFSEVEAKYPSLTLWVDGNNEVFFEEDGERHYVSDGDYIVLKGGKHVVETQKPAEPKKTEPKGPTNTGTSNSEETEMKPGQGSATTEDTK